jgi:hypothetical protein
VAAVRTAERLVARGEQLGDMTAAVRELAERSGVDYAKVLLKAETVRFRE